MSARHLHHLLGRQTLSAARAAARRAYAVNLDQALVFDRNAKRLQRDRAANSPHVKQYEMLKDEMAFQISDRIADINRAFECGLDLGCGRGHLGKVLDTAVVKRLVQCDSSPSMLARMDDNARDRNHCVVCDEEQLPFEANTFDLVASSLSLHWVNNLPECLRQILRVLKPDGVFVGAMFGGDTLFELRCSLQLAEMERHGGFAPHVSPFAGMRDAGSLLQRAGFTLLTVDMDEITINFPSMFELLDDLQGMGESSAAINRPGVLRRDTIVAAAAIYKEMYGNPDGSIPATFQILHMVGWKPDPSQPKALKRGSAERSLKEIGIDTSAIKFTP
eukprot:m.86280 g.86280  ORF g.86280 m.86280 type:complete len:333 (-) comp15078_c0_seq1:137-1135(-)